MKARGYVDFSALLWLGLVLGLVLGACGYCGGSYVLRHVRVEWNAAPEAAE